MEASPGSVYVRTRCNKLFSFLNICTRALFERICCCIVTFPRDLSNSYIIFLCTGKWISIFHLKQRNPVPAAQIRLFEEISGKQKNERKFTLYIHKDTIRNGEYVKMGKCLYRKRYVCLKTKRNFHIITICFFHSESWYVLEWLH